MIVNDIRLQDCTWVKARGKDDQLVHPTLGVLAEIDESWFDTTGCTEYYPRFKYYIRVNSEDEQKQWREDYDFVYDYRTAKNFIERYLNWLLVPGNFEEREENG